MTRFDDRLLDHPVRGQLERLRSLLDQLMEEQRAEADERLPGALDRIPVVIDHIEGLLEAANPALVPVQGLSQMEEPLNRAIEALETLPADPDQIVNFEGAIDDALASSQLLSSTAGFPDEISEVAAGSFGRALRARAAELQAEADGIASRLSEISAEQATLEQESKETFDQRRSDLQGEFDRIAEAVRTEQGRLDQLIPQFEERFADAQGKWSEEWQATKTGFEEGISNTRGELEGQAKETADALSKQVEEVLAEVRKKRDEVAELYRVVSDTSSSGAFSKEADEQKRAADVWRVVAVGCGAMTVALAVAAVAFAALNSDGSVSSHLTSLVVAAAAGGLTAYAARQSGHHRDREDETRRLALELAAFGPFTSELAEPERAREGYVDRLFKGAEHERKDDATIGKDQVSLIQTLIESLMKIRS